MTILMQKLFGRLQSKTVGALGTADSESIPLSDTDTSTEGLDMGNDVDEASTNEAAARTPTPKAKAKVEEKPAPNSVRAAKAELDGTPDPDAETDEETDVDPNDPDGELAAAAAREGKKDTRIPLSRHESVLNRERQKREALEQQLAQYQGAQALAKTNQQLTETEGKIEKLEKEYTELLTDGKVQEAAAKMKEIRVTEREVARIETERQVAAATAQATESARFTTTLERVESAYPVLNPDHDDYDEKVSVRVVRLLNANKRDGMTPSAALQDAVEGILGAPKTDAQKVATQVKARVAADEVSTDPAVLAARRKAAAVAKTVAAAKGTPADTSKVGMDTDKAGKTAGARDVTKMSMKEFDALGEAEVESLLGNEIG